jgi:hypothetical protein
VGDMLKQLERRLEGWEAHVGTRSEFSGIAPKIVAQLKAEIEARKKEARGG